MEELLELQKLGTEKGYILYDISYRRAGWGVLWHKENSNRPPPGYDWHNDLVVYKYYPTLQEMVEGEMSRLQEL